MKRRYSPLPASSPARCNLVRRTIIPVFASAVCIGTTGCSGLLGPGAGDQTAALPATEVVGTTIPETSTPGETGDVPESDSEETSKPEEEALEVEEAAPPAVIAVVDEAESVLSIINDHPDLKTFASLVAGYPQQQVFTQARGVTIFVPNDAAFAAMGPEKVEEMALDSNLFTLFLSAHMAIGNHSMNSVSTIGLFTNALAQELSVTRSEGSVTVGSAGIETPDLSASNGMIHIVDGAITE